MTDLESVAMFVGLAAIVSSEAALHVGVSGRKIAAWWVVAYAGVILHTWGVW